MAPSHRTRIIATNLDHNERFTQDIQDNVRRVLAANPTMTPSEALLEVQKDMLKNNPFVPPSDGRCLINTMLPVELLTHIFRLGVEMDREDEDGEFEEVTEGQEKKELEEELESSDDEPEAEADDAKKTDKTGKPKRKELGDVEMEVVEEAGDDSDWEDEEPDTSMSDGETDEDDETDDEDEEPHTPFEVLVSHVCRHWREAAVNTPDLWSWIEFVAPPRWEMHKTYLERAKGHPLTLEIDGTREGDASSDNHPDHPDYVEGDYSDLEPFYSSKDIHKIFEMLVPVASQWHRVDIIMSSHRDMEYALNMLRQIPEAPMLESLHMHDEEVCDRYDDWEVGEFLDKLTLPFHGRAPNLRTVDLWGVHVDWDAAVSLFQNLKHLNLAYHIDRPSFKAFATYLRNSPKLELLELDTSGPQAVNFPLVPSSYSPPLEEDREKVEEADPWTWQAYPLEVPSLRELSLSGHEPDYAQALAQTFFFPDVKGISLAYPNGEFSETIMTYATPSRRASTRRSMFQIIESLQLLELGHVNPEAQNAMFEALAGLKNLCLGSIEQYDEDESTIGKIWKALYDNTLAVSKDERGTSQTQIDGEEPKIPTKLLLPHLSAIQTRGVDGTEMRDFVDGRKSLGLPLKAVMMHSGSDVTEKDERWLRANVEEFDYFSDSDEEDSMDDDYFDVSVHGDDSDLGAEWSDEAGDDGTEDEWTDEE